MPRPEAESARWAPDPRAARTRRATALAVFVLVVVLAVTYARAVRDFPLNVDAGYWIPRARMTVRGLAPIADFDTAYAPGPYYLFALLGERGLRSPAAIKAGVYVFECLGALVLFGILRRHGSTVAASALWSAICLAWIVTCDGLAVEVEPAQTLFALAALWLLSRPGAAWTVFAAGALAGAAVLAKQYSVLFLPALALAAAFRPDAADKSASGRWKRAALFAAGVPVAFALFVLFTGQNAAHAFLRLATYGGARYPADGIVSMLGALATGRAARPLGLALVLAAWMLVRRRSPRVVVLAAGLSLSALPLYVRNYEHYVQLAAPWAVLVAAEFVRGLDIASIRRTPATLAAAFAAATLVAFELAPIAGGVAGAYATMDRRPISQQVEIAEKVAAAAGSPRDVLVVNVEWIYVLTDLEAPLPRRELRYTQGLETLDDLRDAARCAVLAPGHTPLAEARAWLEAGGLRVAADVAPQVPVLVFGRAPK